MEIYIGPQSLHPIASPVPCHLRVPLSTDIIPLITGQWVSYRVRRSKVSRKRVMTSSIKITQEVHGTIVRKKKQKDWVVYAIEVNPGEPTIKAYLSRKMKGASSEGRALNAHFDVVCQQFLFLQATIRLQGFSETVQTSVHLTEDRFYISAVDLIQCAPDPIAVENVLKCLATSDKRFDPESLLMEDYVQESSEDDPEKNYCSIAQNILSLEGRNRRLAIARFVRILEGSPTARKGPRHRPPHIRRSHLRLLNRIEGLGRDKSSWELMEPKAVVHFADKTPEEELQKLPFNLPSIQQGSSCTGSESKSVVSDPSLDSQRQLPLDAETRSRVGYLTDKKHPQVQWMTNRVQNLLAERPFSSATTVHILDVGGGRGDLATALAMAIPEAIVTVVDLNFPSLEAGLLYARQLGLSDRMHFVHADFREFISDTAHFYSTKCLYSDKGEDAPHPPPPINCVVALHACGDLSDLALAFSDQLSCPFVLCPCCYTKHYNSLFFEPAWCKVVSSSNVELGESRENENDSAVKVIGRLAELNEDPEVSRRAMTAINSMRLASVRGRYNVALEAYEDKSSKRNLVCIGFPV